MYRDRALVSRTLVSGCSSSASISAFIRPGGSLPNMSPLEALASGTDDGGAVSRPIINLTDAALAKLLELRADETDADQLGLRVAVASGPGEDFRYDLSFDEFLKAAFTDEVRTHEGADGRSIKVVVPGSDTEFLRGATLDFTDSQGLVIRNH